MDWKEFDALTDAEVMARAMTDPDNKPLTKEDLRRMKRRPRAYVIRRAVRMTQEEFADAFGLSLPTLRDWEQGRYEPDNAAKTLLRVIATNPDAVKAALKTRAAAAR